MESALTVNVTHVVASGFGSAKYLVCLLGGKDSQVDFHQYAVEHRLHVMAPSWIQNGHARWLKGEELDLMSEIEIHKLKPFLGLKIAISGIEPSTSDLFFALP